MKNAFYFNKSQRIGIVILIAAIALSILLIALLPAILSPENAPPESDFLEEARAFKASLKEKERTQRRRPDFYPFESRNFAKNNRPETAYQLFDFNPNTADSAAFVRLGLKPYVARNILKYRAKGGTFRTADGFAKIYGITPEKFNELAPYIQIAENKTVEKESAEPATAENTDETAPRAAAEAPVEIAPIDLNNADTAALKTIKGVGATFAKRIVGYRRLLGGYYAVEQLHEVYGMTPEHYAQISPYTLIGDNPPLIKINVNKASIEKLKKHPYIKTFQRAKAIYEYRRKKVKLESISQLKHLEEFTASDWEKLTPYLEFQ